MSPRAQGSRLIVALDYPDADSALRFVSSLVYTPTEELCIEIFMDGLWLKRG